MYLNIHLNFISDHKGLGMEHILSSKSVSLTELRDPAKVLAHAGDSPVAVLNRNKVVGYLVPLAAVAQVDYQAVDKKQLQEALNDSKEQVQPILDYLKDK